MYALITGASSGLGRGLAYVLAADNYDLILVARRDKLLSEIKDEIIEKHNVKVVVFSYDLSDIANCVSLFDKLEKYEINLFINNAGFGNLGYFNETDLSVEMQMIDLNIKALQTLTKLYIKTHNKGKVVNISSMAALLPTPIHATYSATKSYVYYFSRAINYELKKQGKNVKVLTVAPGPVKTNFNNVAKASRSKGMDVNKCVRLIYRGIKKEKELIIPGFTMKIIYFFSRFIPTKILMKTAHKIQSSK